MKILKSICTVSLALGLAAARAAEPNQEQPPTPGAKPDTKQENKKVSANEVAVIKTTEGEMVVEFWPDVAPKTVENFKTLARKGFYDGTCFHRVIKGFMIQGGDPLGIGTGNPGYKFEDEISPNLKFDKPGLLAMANAGPGTNGSQFFITEGTPAHLTGRHTIFGQCDPLSLVTKITGVERGPRDRPVTDVVMKKVTISRGKKKK